MKSRKRSKKTTTKTKAHIPYLQAEIESLRKDNEALKNRVISVESRNRTLTIERNQVRAVLHTGRVSLADVEIMNSRLSTIHTLMDEVRKILGELAPRAPVAEEP